MDRKRKAKVRCEDFGDAWPLTVDEGTLIREPDGAVAFRAGRRTYAVNGLAARKYPGIEPIWAKVGEVDGEPLRKSIRPLIQRAESLT